jgi:hypothetical protein
VSLNPIDLEYSTERFCRFLLARLHVNSLASKTNKAELKKALLVLPRELDESYSKAMARIQSQSQEDQELALQVFLWLTYTQYPLTAGALQAALAVRPGIKNIDTDYITHVDILISVCAGLVVLEGEGLRLVREWSFTPTLYQFNGFVRFLS